MLHEAIAGCTGGEPWIDDVGCLHADLQAQRWTVEDARTLGEAARRILGGDHTGVILDARQVEAFQPSAWVQTVTDVETFASAVAFVVSERTQRQVAIYQARIDSLIMPCRWFDDPEAAEAWIAPLSCDRAA